MTKERLLAIEIDATTRTTVDADMELELIQEIRRLQQEVDSWKTTCETLESGLGTKLLADRIEQLQQENERTEKEMSILIGWHNREMKRVEAELKELRSISMDKQKMLKRLDFKKNHSKNNGGAYRATIYKEEIDDINSGQFDWREGE